MKILKQAFSLRLLWLAMSAFLALLVTSCADDEKDEPESESESDQYTEERFSSSLVGTWSYTDVDGMTYVLRFYGYKYKGGYVEEITYLNRKEMSYSSGMYFFDGEVFSIMGWGDIEFKKNYGSKFTAVIKDDMVIFKGESKEPEFHKVRDGLVTQTPEHYPEIDNRIIGTWEYTKSGGGNTYRLQFSKNGDVFESVSKDNFISKTCGKFTFGGNYLVLPENMSFYDNFGGVYLVGIEGNSMNLVNRETLELDMAFNFIKKE